MDLPQQVWDEHEGCDRGRDPRPRGREHPAVVGKDETNQKAAAEPRHADLVEEPETDDEAERDPVPSPAGPRHGWSARLTRHRSGTEGLMRPAERPDQDRYRDRP